MQTSTPSFYSSYSLSDLLFLIDFSSSFSAPSHNSSVLSLIIQKSSYLSPSHRELFSSSTKRVLEKYRSALRVVSLIRASSSEDTFQSSSAIYIASHVFSISTSLFASSKSLLSSLDSDSYLSEEYPDPAAKEEETAHDRAEAFVFYSKMMADYYRYILEALAVLLEYVKDSSKSEEERSLAREDVKGVIKEHFYKELQEIQEIGESKENREVEEFLEELMKRFKKECSRFYGEALNKSREFLEATNTVFLGTVLNYTVFLYEIQGNRDDALFHAEKYYQEGLEGMNSVKEHEYEKTNIILMLIKDNIEGWKNEGEKKRFRKSTNY